MKKRFTLTLVKPQRELSLTSSCQISEPFDPDRQKKPYPTPISYNAIWDTGATFCAITQRVVDELNLVVKRPVVTDTANGQRSTYAYLINVVLPNNVLIPGRWATLSTIQGADILIGMDIISRGDFAVSRIGENTKFTFQLPPTHALDFEAERLQLERYYKIYQERLKHGNKLCPCGSGKQWDKCHGKE